MGEWEPQRGERPGACGRAAARGCCPRSRPSQAVVAARLASSHGLEASLPASQPLSLWPGCCGSTGHSPGALTGVAWDRWALLVATGPGTSRGALLASLAVLRGGAAAVGTAGGGGGPRPPSLQFGGPLLPLSQAWLGQPAGLGPCGLWHEMPQADLAHVLPGSWRGGGHHWKLHLGL